MKKTTLLLVGFCVFFITIYETQALNPRNLVLSSTETILPYGYEELELHGDLVMSVGPDAIDAGVGENDVLIQFNQRFGNVSISFYNESGALIYNNVVNTDVQQSVIIPINNANSGSYSLELNNPNGSAEGFFEH